MTSRPSRVLVAFCLLFLVVATPPRPATPPPIVTPSTTPQSDWSEALSRRLDAHIYELAQFFVWAAEQEAQRAEEAAAKAAQQKRARVAASSTATTYEDDESVWALLAQCESGGRWDYNGPSGYDGGLQFSPGTWTGHGGAEFAEYAWQASPSQQIAVAERVLASQGWGAWPSCSRKLGLR